ncbi:hypothetical protein L195_g024425 [Trifolium pratense]|uniref:Reverse transcriptase domain-containing protein n=1 Tax=Trifolium pratense TaxID=57577 RepID=A0A2K3NDM2_TRIPR|nr:hypothetical protein L195_g024425 [Trifolium pratense]
MRLRSTQKLCGDFIVQRSAFKESQRLGEEVHYQPKRLPVHPGPEEVYISLWWLTCGVVNLWLGGRCPMDLSEIVASAFLTPLLKPGGGIRPIVVGIISRHLVSKVAMKRVSSGAEAILHGGNRVLSQLYEDDSLDMLTVDFSNAFNMVDRSTLLHEIRDNFKLLLHTWYLDGGTIIGDSEEMAKSLNIIQEIDIGRLMFGVKLLGGTVTRDKGFFEGVAMKRVVKAVELMHMLLWLPEPNLGVLLARSPSSLKLNIFLRVPSAIFGVREIHTSAGKCRGAWMGRK